MYNVRVRTRISPGVWREWGDACRLMINNAQGQCKLSGLVNDLTNSNYCCGKTITLPVGNQGNGWANHLVAWPVVRYNNNCENVTATKYQFRFRIPAEAVTIVLNSPTNVRYMTAAAGFANCKTYTVEVRASFDGGSTWCNYSEACNVFTGGCANGGNENHVSAGPQLQLYPNPNRGDQLFIDLHEIDQTVTTVSVDIYDAFGRRVMARTIPAQDGFLNTILDLDGQMSAGVYVVNITAGEASFTERLVIQH